MFLRRFTLYITLIALVLASGVTSTAAAAGRTRPPHPSGLVRTATLNATAIDQALAYLQTQQDSDGGIPGFTPGSSDAFTTARTAMALASAGVPVTFLTKSGKTPLDYLASQAIAYTHQTSGPPLLFPGRAGILAVAVVGSSGNPRAFGAPTTMDLIGELDATYDPTTGTYSTAAVEGFSSGAPSTINQLWAILGLAAAQQAVPTLATTYLVSQQDPDGGWGYGFGSDIDTTALVIQALLASGNLTPDSSIIQNGVTFLRSNQISTGGWAPYGTLSADSTAGVIQALVADGYVPPTASWTTTAGRNPLDELLGLQAPDGSFSGNALGAADSIPGLAEVALPVFGRTQSANLALSWLHSQQNADGSWTSPFGNVGSTCDATLAFASAGFDPSTIKATGSTASALDYLAANAAAFAVGASPDQAGKLALTVKAAGKDPTSFGGVNLINAINSYYDNPTAGAYGDATNTWYQSFAILGLAAAGQPIPPAAVTTLEGLQQAGDGGWKYDLSPFPGNVSAPDSTGLALQALIAAKVPNTDAHIINGKKFLRANQDGAGGWSDANDTAYAMQGLLAAGEDLVANWSVGGHSPFNALESYQKSDGPFVYSWNIALGQPVDNGLATSQAIPALLGVHYPYVPGGSLGTFADVARGPNPDRLVSAAPRLVPTSTGANVTVPFGSDVDDNGTVTLSYRVNGGPWQQLTTTRATGSFSATITSAQPASYVLQANFADPEGVQGPTTISQFQTYLPLIDNAVGRGP